jgi:hypothetical protein
MCLNIIIYQGGRPMNAPTFKQRLSYKNRIRAFSGI